MTFDKNFIEKIRKRLESHRELYERNEAAVRQQIIDPVLRELGWDIENPDEVVPEDNTGEGGFPDYSLLKDNRKIILLEAKKLREETMQNIKQLARYSSDVGSRYGLITNGSDFVLFKSYEEFKPYIDRVIWRVNLENDSIERVIRNLSSLSPHNVMKIEELAEKSDKLNSLWDELIEDPETFSSVFSSYFLDQLGSRFVQFKYDIEEVRDFLREKAESLLSPETAETSVLNNDNGDTSYSNRYYTKMKLQGREYRITAQNQILINVANWLVEKGKLSRNNVPIESGYKRYLINKENRNRNGKPLPGGKLIDGGLWVMLNLSASNIVAKSYELLERFGYDKKTLELD